jgi:hypothetical protein
VHQLLNCCQLAQLVKHKGLSFHLQYRTAGFFKSTAGTAQQLLFLRHQALCCQLAQLVQHKRLGVHLQSNKKWFVSQFVSKVTVGTAGAS